MNSPYPSSKGAKGLKAINDGDNLAAFPLLEEAFAEGDDHLHVLTGLAAIARAYGKFETCLAAADRYLQTEPGDIEMNIFKADALAGLGREKAAVNFYMAALRLAPEPERLPAHIAREVGRAREICQRAQAAYEEEFRRRLAGLGLQSGDGSSRLEQAVDVMLGRKEVYLPQPGKFYFPELPPVQFYDPTSFDWAQAVRDGKDAIKAELEAALSDPDLFEPYMAHNPIAPATTGTGLDQSEKWSAIHLCKDGVDVAETVKRFPKTMEVISAAPIARIPGRSPNILFSRLQPGAHIPPHHGQINIRLLCHVPLIAPQGCSLRVGNQQRAVVEGELMIFDDTIEHEARNQGAADRIVLIFDIWRPELTQEERNGLVKIFEAIKTDAPPAAG